MKKFLSVCFFLLGTTLIFAQSYKERLNSIDVKRYQLYITLNDSTDQIDATMKVFLKFRKQVDQFNLDLVQKDSISGKGMKIDSIYQNNVAVDFTHENNKVNITPKHPFPGVEYTYTIKYSGIPTNGLIISKNLLGDRTFFGDNWPNRAHHWMPCVDHPSDKAYFESIITAPNHYQAIANGTLIEQTNINDDWMTYHHKSTVPIPTKVMVIGVARFAVQNTGLIGDIPVSTWVYPQTKEKGFLDYSKAKHILQYFIDNYGPYPYSKLANVQSTTMFGGMENASNIFYYEQSVTGEQKVENLIAHEIAHQWFGNSASEIDWAHVWLSEGFATYLTNLYILDTKGEQAFIEQLTKDRNRVLGFFKRSPTPVVDPNTTDYMKLLNPNSYQKGGWVLHMLRKKIGDEKFRYGVKVYYDKFKLGNASSEDFRDVMAQVSGQNLDTFFDQWLYRVGQPKLKTNWITGATKVRLIIDQVQEVPFEFLLDIELVYKDGTKEIQTVEVFAKSAPYVLDTKGEVKEINLDPNVNLLYELEE